MNEGNRWRLILTCEYWHTRTHTHTYGAHENHACCTCRMHMLREVQKCTYFLREAGCLFLTHDEHSWRCWNMLLSDMRPMLPPAPPSSPPPPQKKRDSDPFLLLSPLLLHGANNVCKEEDGVTTAAAAVPHTYVHIHCTLLQVTDQHALILNDRAL